MLPAKASTVRSVTCTFLTQIVKIYMSDTQSIIETFPFLAAFHHK